MKDKNIGFIGCGFVGNAVLQSFKNHFNCEIFDIVKEKATTSSIQELMEKCKVIFMALPTPTSSNGDIYLNDIESAYQEINKYSDEHIVVLKSSVPPGTTKFLNSKFPKVFTIFNPEFLTEKNAVSDFANQERIILGGDYGNKLLRVVECYKKVFPDTIIQITDSSTAEMTKFFINIFLATKVSLSNEFYRICEKMNISYDDVRHLSTQDSRIGLSHTKVPGDGTGVSSGGFGFSGTCFPLNLSILKSLAKKLEVETPILNSVEYRNNNLDRPQMDWKKYTKENK